MKKLYCLIRNDLKPEHKAVQGGHAIAQYFLDHQRCEWDNGTIIYLRVPDEASLITWINKLNGLGHNCSHFIEEDLNKEYTACCTILDTKLFSNLGLLKY